MTYRDQFSTKQRLHVGPFIWRLASFRHALNENIQFRRNFILKSILNGDVSINLYKDRMSWAIQSAALSAHLLAIDRLHLQNASPNANLQLKDQLPTVKWKPSSKNYTHDQRKQTNESIITCCGASEEAFPIAKDSFSPCVSGRRDGDHAQIVIEWQTNLTTKQTLNSCHKALVLVL